MTTVIVTGLPGTAKTLVQSMLQILGIPMQLSKGEGPDPVDQDLHHALMYEQGKFPTALVQQRNQEHRIWGFRMAFLHNALTPMVVNQFRSPKVIMMHRDTVSISEAINWSFSDVLVEQQRGMYFAARLECPVLHMPAEKVFRDPAQAMVNMGAFLA